MNEYGPRGKPVKAKLVKKVTADGISFVKDDIPLGTVYDVYPDSV